MKIFNENSKPFIYGTRFQLELSKDIDKMFKEDYPDLKLTDTPHDYRLIGEDKFKSDPFVKSLEQTIYDILVVLLEQEEYKGKVLLRQDTKVVDLTMPVSAGDVKVFPNWTAEINVTVKQGTKRKDILSDLADELLEF